MDTDFHFYGTASAACTAGFRNKEAQMIANAAEFVDFFDSKYWSNWAIVPESGEPGVIKTPQLSTQTIDYKMATDYDADLWCAFHFPPGNIEYQPNKPVKYNSLARFSNQWKRRDTKRDIRGEMLCRPYSKYAFDMIVDTIDSFRAWTDDNNGPDALKTRLEQEFGKDDKEGRIRLMPTEPEEVNALALTFLGIRMHVLADTWAHQDFSGIASKDLNGAGTLNNVYYLGSTEPALWELSTWTGTAWALHKDTDCAAAPDIVGSQACRGHGQIGHFPDYSWLRFLYPAAWLPDGGTRLLMRSNPEQYVEAWLWLMTVMAECLNHSPIITTVPDEIKKVIGQGTRLNAEKLEAVQTKERDWDKMMRKDYNFSVTARWNSDHGTFTSKKLTELGVVGDLPWTRLGYVTVKRNSILHIMELASALHFKWSARWAERNPNYGWLTEAADISSRQPPLARRG